jgi:glucose/arabinose dehydrogenase/chitodextrinase
MRTRSVRNALTVLFCVLLGISTARTGAETFSDPNFTSEVVATLSPYTLVGMAWAPDGRLFVWQKNGVVRVIKQGVLLPTPFIDLSDRVNTFDDRGFWGLAFHPDFANNGYVYLSYVYEQGGDSNDSNAKTSRLTRVTASPGNPDVAIPGSEVVILGSIGTPPCSAHPAGADCLPADSGSHSIGTLRFAPDGTLFVGNGDGADASFVDPNSMRAQDIDSWSGKILRIRDDGTAPTDNPFYDGTNSIRSKVWLYGVRNPFRFNLHPLSNEPYFGDVGWHTWEEVNRGMRARNYGWPCFEGNLPAPGYQTTFPLCQQLTSGDVVAPLYTYNHSVGTAVIAGPVYVGSTYPEAYVGSLFFADYSGGFIRRMVLDVNGNSLGVVPFATSVDSPVTLELGPDALLYYLAFGAGEIRRIRYNGPSAVLSATPTFGYSPLTVSFSSAGSINPGGGALTYLWEFGDGNTSTQANPSHTYVTGTVTSYTARLTVRNTAGITSSATVRITVGSRPPTATISAPGPGTTALPGETVTFQGSATDPDEGLLPPTALSWTVLLHHNSHVHTFVGGSGSQGSFVAQSHGSIGTFSYEIILTATDSSGLSASTSVPVAIAADTVLPTTPTGLTASAVSPTQVNLSWTAATDNVGVTGYRVERCQGNGCTNFVEVATPAGTSFNDTGRTPQTTYRYQVRAADAANNLGPYSGIASATTPNVPAPVGGLVAAYAFNEGSGTTVTDASVSGNTGTITGATWTPSGRFGAALSFNGVNNLVQIPGSSSLNVSTAMTLEAWIFPTAAQSGWRTIMQREATAYFLNSSNGNGAMLPGGGGTFGVDIGYASGAVANPVNAWTHVALTYDGAMLQLYVNGVLASNVVQTGNIQTNSNPLSIGGNGPFGEFFQGVIDEVRVYNRALSQAEIQADMTTPIIPSAPDTTPPSAPSGLGATAASATQINLAWTAAIDDIGVAGYRVERCQGTSCTNFTEVATPTGTSFNDTGRSPSTSYRYQVRAADAAGNLGPYSNIASATTPASGDTTPPSAPGGLTASVVSPTQVNLSWTAATDNVGVTGYRVERCQGNGCTNFVEVATPAGTSFNDTGRTPQTTYRYQVRAADAANNLGPYSGIASATTPALPDTTPPSATSGLTASAVSATQVDLSWTAATDDVGVAGYRVERCQGASCTNFAQIATPATTTYSDTGRTGTTTYRYRVRAADAAGNLGAYSNIAAATTSDGTPPSAPSGLTATAASATQINLSWTAATDNVGVAGYRVERCQGTSCTNFTQIAAPTGTSFNDTGRTDATTYRYRVRAIDAAGNLGAYSSIASATTPDATPPIAPSGLTATPVSATRINLAWTAATDNVAVTGYRVERCQGATCTNFVQISTPTATSYADTGRTSATTYRYRVRAIDAAGNLGAYSSIVTATTLDGTPPSAPSGLSATAVSATQVNLVWNAATDNVGVTGYRVERCQGASCTNFAQIATPTATSHNDTGRTAATTYRYRVRAVDAAGNVGAFSTIASATTPASGDTIPPSAPSGLTASAVSATQVNLAWTAATDNVGVTGYRVERCQGASCINFAQVAAPTGTSFNDTGAAASTTYLYQVRAVDAAGNLGPYSNVASATTPDLPPPVGGLVAAYAFNEGSGNTVNDLSGNGNNGTITGAAWTPAGRFGGALSFNGTSNRVQIPASSSLNLSTAMTLEAWIFPTATQSGWRTIMQREADAYFLNASNGNGPLLPGGGGTFGGSIGYASGAVANPVNAWTHVALTYDGAMLRLYVNGVLASNVVQTGGIQTNGNPLSIGGNGPYGEFFQGVIDNVRVYNRALSEGEIQAGMTVPVGP